MIQPDGGVKDCRPTEGKRKQKSFTPYFSLGSLGRLVLVRYAQMYYFVLNTMYGELPEDPKNPVLCK